MLKAKHAAGKHVNKLNISCFTWHWEMHKGTAFVNDLKRPQPKTSISK